MMPLIINNKRRFYKTFILFIIFIVPSATGLVEIEEAHGKTNVNFLHGRGRRLVARWNGFQDSFFPKRFPNWGLYNVWTRIVLFM